MFSNPLAKVFGGANVEMARNGERFENVNVVHSHPVRLRPAMAGLRRDAFALWLR